MQFYGSLVALNTKPGKEDTTSVTRVTVQAEDILTDELIAMLARLQAVRVTIETVSPRPTPLEQAITDANDDQGDGSTDEVVEISRGRRPRGTRSSEVGDE